MSITTSSFTSTTKLSLFNSAFFFSFNVLSKTLKAPALSFPFPYSPRKRKSTSGSFNSSFRASAIASHEVEEKVEEEEVADGYTMTQFCDKMIDVFLKEKPRVKQWRKYLVFRDEWNKYKERFYSRCQTRADAESDPNMKHKLITLASKVRKIDDEMEKQHGLLKEIQDSPTDLNAIVTRRRKDFTGEFFRYLSLVSQTNDSLEDRDGEYPGRLPD